MNESWNKYIGSAKFTFVDNIIKHLNGENINAEDLSPRDFDIDVIMGSPEGFLEFYELKPLNINGKDIEGRKLIYSLIYSLGNDSIGSLGHMMQSKSGYLRDLLRLINKEIEPEKKFQENQTETNEYITKVVEWMNGEVKKPRELTYNASKKKRKALRAKHDLLTSLYFKVQKRIVLKENRKRELQAERAKYLKIIRKKERQAKKKQKA